MFEITSENTIGEKTRPGVINTPFRMKERGLILDKLHKRQLILQLNRFLDIVLTLLAYISAYHIRNFFPQPAKAGLSESPNYVIIAPFIVIIWFLVFIFFNVNTNNTNRFINVFISIVKAITTGLFLLVMALFIFKVPEVSRLILGIFYINNLLLITTSKALIFYVAKISVKSDYKKLNIIIIGSKERAEGAISLINTMKDQYSIIGCLDTHKERINKRIKDGVTVIGMVDDIQSILVNNVVDEVIFAMPMFQIENVEAHIQLIELMGIKVRIFPDWHIHSLLYEPRVAQIYFDELNGIPSMVLSSTSTRQRDLLLKLFFDYFFSGLMQVLLSPIMLLISALIKISSKGPVFFMQERVGLNGRKFKVYKFRTMVRDAEAKLSALQSLNEADGPAFKIQKDPRIIPFIGTLLRKTSLDELPQLINVLKGEMSLIGPRPPLCSEVAKYNIWHRRRLSMKPGITCIWQIQPNRNDLSFDQWMDLDLEYIDNWSLKLDFEVFVKTIVVMGLGYGR